jgi:hypothetical protein
MTTPPSLDIMQALIRDLGYRENENIFVGLEPSTPDNVLTIYDIHSRRTRLMFDPTEMLERPSLQIRVRGRRQQETWSRARSVVEYLERLSNVRLGDSRYLLFYVDFGLGLLDQDSNNRWRYYVNLETQRTKYEE